MSCNQEVRDKEQLLSIAKDRIQPDSIRLNAASLLMKASLEHQDHESLIFSWTAFGDIYQHKKADSCYQTGLQLSKEFKLPLLEAHLLNKLAVNRRRQRLFGEADSLHRQAIQILPESNDSIEASILNSRGITHMNALDYQRAREYFEKAYYLSNKGQWKGQTAAVLNNLGLLSQREASYGPGLYYYQEGLKIRIDLADTLEIARIHKNMGIVYNKLGEYVSSVSHLSTALQGYASINMGATSEVASAYNSLGVAYYRLEDYEKSLSHYRKSGEIRAQKRYWSGLSSSYNNMANVFQKLGELDSAEYYMQQAITLKKDHGQESNLVVNYLNLGEIFLRKNQPQMAKNWLDKAWELSQIRSNDRTRTSILLSLADYYLQVEDTDRALVTLDSASHVIGRLNTQDLLMEATNLYRQVYFAQDNSQLAQRYDNKYDSLKEAVITHQRLRIVEMQAAKEQEKLRNQAIEQSIAMDRSRENRRLVVKWLITVSIIMSILVILYLVLARKNRVIKDSLTKTNQQVKDLSTRQHKINRGLKEGLIFFEDHMVVKDNSKDRNKAIIIFYRDLILIRSNGDYLDWYMTKGKKVSVRATLDSVEQDISRYGLLRAHRSWVVNENFVTAVEEEKDDEAIFLKLKQAVTVLVPENKQQKRKGMTNTSFRSIPVSKTYLRNWEVTTH